MDVLDVMVGDDDLTTLDQDLIWKEGGMACPVINCGSQMFQKYAALQAHWWKVHHPTFRRHVCYKEGCSASFVRCGKLRQHLLRVHGTPDTGEDLASRTGKQEFPNQNFVDPAGAKMPLPPDLMERSRRKKMEQVRRRREAEASQASTEVLIKRIYQCRDVYVHFDQNGRASEITKPIIGSKKRPACHALHAVDEDFSQFHE